MPSGISPRGMGILTLSQTALPCDREETEAARLLARRSDRVENQEEKNGIA